MANRTISIFLPILTGILILRWAKNGKIGIDDLNSAVATIRTLSKI